MRSWFPEDFSRQLSPLRLPDQNPASSSSSLSMDSPKYSSLLFNIPSRGDQQREHRVEVMEEREKGLGYWSLERERERERFELMGGNF